MTLPTEIEKHQTINDKNTYFFINDKFENKYQKYIESLISEFVELQLKIKKNGCNEKVIGDLIEEDNGLILITSCSALSFEMLEGIITYLVLKNDENLDVIFNTSKWRNSINQKNKSNNCNITISKIQKFVKTNRYLKECIVKLFFFGYNIPELRNVIPLFELSKLNPSKLNTIDTIHPEVFDSLLRGKLKGSYSASKERNAEIIIETALNKLNVPYTRGDLPLLSRNEKTRKRTLDFIIPDKENPKVIIECSYVCTTSSGMGDKAKAENGVNDLIEKYYPGAIFIGFVDGIGWVSRHKDAKRMCEAFDDVYTFHDSEMKRFEEAIKEILPEYF